MSPLLVIMRVAQSRVLNKESGVVTGDELLPMSAPCRPRLSLKLDFRPRDFSDLEEGESRCDPPMAPTTRRLPKPLPFVMVKSGPPSATEMLDSEKMGGLCKSQDSRRASRTTLSSPWTLTYLSSCASSRDDLEIEEVRLPGPPGVVNTPS